jgi:hypothetical protein
MQTSSHVAEWEFDDGRRRGKGGGRKQSTENTETQKLQVGGDEDQNKSTKKAPKKKTRGKQTFKYQF